jgi:hypothetical protein
MARKGRTIAEDRLYRGMDTLIRFGPAAEGRKQDRMIHFWNRAGLFPSSCPRQRAFNRELEAKKKDSEEKTRRWDFST